MKHYETLILNKLIRSNKSSNLTEMFKNILFNRFDINDLKLFTKKCYFKLIYNNNTITIMEYDGINHSILGRSNITDVTSNDFTSIEWSKYMLIRIMSLIISRYLSKLNYNSNDYQKALNYINYYIKSSKHKQQLCTIFKKYNKNDIIQLSKKGQFFIRNGNIKPIYMFINFNFEIQFQTEIINDLEYFIHNEIKFQNKNRYEGNIITDIKRRNLIHTLLNTNSGFDINELKKMSYNDLSFYANLNKSI